MCPVLAFTPEVERIRAWFDVTHEVEATGMAGLVCRSVRLPAEGSVGDQEGWLWDALTLCRQVQNRIFSEQARRG